MVSFDMEIALSEDEPSEEDERDHWSGKGHIEFFVIQNSKDCFEIEVQDYSGCAGGMNETLGIEYYISDVWCLNDDPSSKLREGVVYTLHNLTVTWTRGDGYATEDDVEYDYTHMTSHATAFGYLSYKANMIWWRAIGHRIKKWRKLPS